MKENLIFGADVISFGAVGDGKTDCTAAFKNALSSQHNLITVPYGEYLITSPLEIGSNTKLHIHPSARIVFDVKNGECLIKGTNDCTSVIVDGGIWSVKDSKNCKVNASVLFNGAQSIKLQNITFTPGTKTAISCKNTEDLRLENICCEAENTIILADCSSCTVRNIKHSGHGDTITFSGLNNGVFVSNISVCSVSTILNVKGAVDDTQIFDINGSFTSCAVCIKDDSNAKYMLICGLNVHCIKSDICKAYFDLSGNIEALSIEGFKRNSDLEALPKCPTLYARNTSISVIIDGLGLDEIISSKAASKITSMLPARLADPHEKFVYTLEATLDKDDSFVIPLGEFYNLEAYSH